MPAIDTNFDGFTHETLPDVDVDFSCKSQIESTTQPECVVDIYHDEQWVRLPVTTAETELNKDGPASVTRTSEINVPATWGRAPDNSKVQIYEYVGTERGQGSSRAVRLRRICWAD